MKNKIIGIFVLALLLGSVTIGAYRVSAQTGSQSQTSINESFEREVPITGDALKKASATALTHTRGGRVTQTEVGDEESYYEVEVTLENGQQVDVQLDEAFKIVGEKIDNESESGR